MPASVVFLLVCSLTALLFSPILTFDFLNWDDQLYVTENELVKAGLTVEGIIAVFSESQVFNWHPVTMLSHMLDVELFGLDPRGHHGTSLVLHALNSGLLFLVLMLATGQRLPALLVAVLFAVHPTHVESVAWISERKDLLSMMFLLLALLAYIKLTQPVLKLIVVTIVLGLGLMSKAMLVTAPILFLLLDIWPLRRIVMPPLGQPWLDWLKSSNVIPCLLEKVPLILLAIIFSLLTLQAQTESIQTLALTTRIENAFVSYGLYLQKLVQPAGLAAFYPHYGEPQTWQLVITVGIVLGFSLLAVYFVRTRPYLFVGWFFFLVSMLPVIGIVQVGVQGLADRYLYIPSVGVFIAAVWLYLDVGRSVRQSLVLIPPIVLTFIFSFQTWTYLPTWQNSITLWQRVLIVNDSAYLPFLESGASSIAVREVPKGLIIPYFNMGDALQGVGLVDDAIMHYQLATSIQPVDGALRRKIGLALFQVGRLSEASRQLQEAIDLGVTDEEVIETLEVIKARSGEVPTS